MAEGNLLPAPPREDKEAAQLMDQYHVEDLDLTGVPRCMHDPRAGACS